MFEFSGRTTFLSHHALLICLLLQVEGCKLKDYGGDYNVFIEGNEVEAEKMAEKEEAQKEQAKSQIKAKSKVHPDFSRFSRTKHVSEKVKPSRLDSLVKSRLSSLMQKSCRNSSVRAFWSNICEAILATVLSLQSATNLSFT